MIVYNLTNSKISVLKPNSGTLTIPANGKTTNEAASAALVKILITMFSPAKIRIQLLDTELGIVDQIPENISNWLKPIDEPYVPEEKIEEKTETQEPEPKPAE